jgi:hypothetical protein
MAECEAKLAIVVRRYRQSIAVCRSKGDGSRRASQSERVRVMVPGTEHRLEKDRKDAEKCGFPARSPPSSADPKPYGHVDFPSPQYHAPSLILFDCVSDRYLITALPRMSNRLS